MLFKLVGAALIVGASSKIGFDFAAALTRRVQQLQDIRLGLSSILTEISFRGTPLAEAMSRSAEVMHTKVREVFTLTGKKLSSDQVLTAKEAFLEALEEYEEALSLKPDDLILLKGFAGLLGTSDLENQTANIEITQKKLDVLVEQAEQQRDKNSKLYRTSGIMAGLVITVLFL